MKNKPLKLRLSYFFGQRSPSPDSSGYMPELIKPASDWQGAEGVIEDILRWADDGGQSLRLGGKRKARPTPDADWEPDNGPEQ